MRAQGRDRVVAAGEVCLAQGCVDFVVTDLMQEHSWSALAALEARDQVMLALRGAGRDRAIAKRANRV